MELRPLRACILAFLLPLSACSFRVAGWPAGASGHGGNGSGLSSSSGSSPVLTLTIRDFRYYAPSDGSTNPDFENVPHTDAAGNPSSGYLGPWPDRGIVESQLGADGKPVYAAAGTTLTTHGAAAFDQWYRDVAGTNVHLTYPLPLVAQPDGTYAYDSSISGVPSALGDATRMFFPIDDGSPWATAFGNQGSAHNYSFTVEAHTTFVYGGGEIFAYRGDDDVFVFIDGQLVIDLGGIHSPEGESVRLDDLGLVRGQRYPLDFFFAERHQTGSDVLIQTTLALEPAPII